MRELALKTGDAAARLSGAAHGHASDTLSTPSQRRGASPFSLLFGGDVNLNNTLKPSELAGDLTAAASASCIAPRYREVAASSPKSALMEPPPPSYLDGVFRDGVADWNKFSGGTLSLHMADLAWTPLERRWEAEGALATTHSTLEHKMQCCRPALGRDVLGG